MSANFESVWMKDVWGKDFPPLSHDTDTEVVIVGGGLAGILSAYTMAKAGKKVIVLEKNKIGRGVTGWTTAFITQSIDTDFTDLIKTFGKTATKEILESHREAIHLIKNIIDEYKIDCDFMECSNYVYAATKKEVKSLKEEADAAKELGLEVKFFEDGSRLGFTNYGFFEIAHQAKFHPLKFLYQLADKLSELGVEIYEETEVTNLISDGNMVSVRTKKGVVIADKAIVATYEPFNKPFSLYFKKGMYVSYVFELEVENLKLPEGIYEDMQSPYHYMRVDKDGNRERVIIGGEDHRKQVPISQTKNFNALKKYVDKIFGNNAYTIISKWRGPILEPADGLAVIGTSQEPNLFYAMAFSGNGMTYSGITALMAREFALDSVIPWREYYRADRIPKLRALMTKGKDYSTILLKGAVKNAFTESEKPMTSPKKK